MQMNGVISITALTHTDNHPAQSSRGHRDRRSKRALVVIRGWAPAGGVLHEMHEFLLAIVGI